MNIGDMLSDVFRSLFQKPATRRYPYERVEAPAGLRGKLQWNPENCTGCCLCSKDCPADAIEVITVDKANKRFVVRYHADRCTFCAQCVQSCRQGCLQMSNKEWELAGTSKEPFTVYYGDEADVEHLLVRLAEANDNVSQEK